MNSGRIGLVLALAICSCGAAAFDSGSAEQALEAYTKDYQQKPAGVHSSAKYTFFVVDQPCEGNKKYAGTRESKLATREALTLMAEYVTKNGGTDQCDDDSGCERAKQTVINGHRIVDRDTGNCSRRVVYFLPKPLQ